jgi:DNA-binding response OmpR family regulator
VGCRCDVHGLLDRPDGLLLVANDYILKPFQPAMMCGRIRAVFTRRRLVAA